MSSCGSKNNLKAALCDSFKTQRVAAEEFTSWNHYLPLYEETPI